MQAACKRSLMQLACAGEAARAGPGASAQALSQHADSAHKTHRLRAAGPHFTSPAMSTISRNAGTSLLGLYTSHSHLKRSSGTLTRAWLAAAARPASVQAQRRVRCWRVQLRLLREQAGQRTLDCAEGKVLRGDAHLGEHVEQRRLAHVWQADDAHLCAHAACSTAIRHACYLVAQVLKRSLHTAHTGGYAHCLVGELQIGKHRRVRLCSTFRLDLKRPSTGRSFGPSSFFFGGIAQQTYARATLLHASKPAERGSCRSLQCDAASLQNLLCDLQHRPHYVYGLCGGQEDKCRNWLPALPQAAWLAAL